MNATTIYEISKSLEMAFPQNRLISEYVDFYLFLQIKDEAVELRNNLTQFS
jgi:hypothetical protein